MRVLCDVYVLQSTDRGSLDNSVASIPISVTTLLVN